MIRLDTNSSLFIPPCDLPLVSVRFNTIPIASESTVACQWVLMCSVFTPENVSHKDCLHQETDELLDCGLLILRSIKVSTNDFHSDLFQLSNQVVKCNHQLTCSDRISMGSQLSTFLFVALIIPDTQTLTQHISPSLCQQKCILYHKDD